jgi:hypothetical protein
MFFQPVDEKLDNPIQNHVPLVKKLLKGDAYLDMAIREHEIADVTKKARIYTILLEIFTLCLCF